MVVFRRRAPADCCFICRGRMELLYQANCSHWFCGDCIRMTWRKGSDTFQSSKCPGCQRWITLLVPREAWTRELQDANPTDVVLLQWYNHMFVSRPSSAKLGVVGFLDDLFVLLICCLRVAAIYRSVLYDRHGRFLGAS